DHYPIEAQFEGAPIITQRSGLGTRHVPRRSPWGGYDLSQTALPPEQRLIDQPKPDQGRSKPQRDLAASPAPTSTRSVDGPSLGFRPQPGMRYVVSAFDESVGTFDVDLSGDLRAEVGWILAVGVGPDPGGVGGATSHTTAVGA